MENQASSDGTFSGILLINVKTNDWRLARHVPHSRIRSGQAVVELQGSQ